MSRAEASMGLVVVGAALSVSCGYRALRAQAPAEALHVAVVRGIESDALAADEVASGVRDELARAAALLPGDGWPRVEIEVLRAGEASEGIVAAGDSPRARGLGISMVARAWLARAPDAPPERDSGDVRAEVTIAVDALDGTVDARWAAARRAAALRATARRMGRQLARHIEGLPW
ncbi:MAG: hypothetical protein ABTD50_11905 [Polyangiaceae bacterium]